MNRLKCAWVIAPWCREREPQLSPLPALPLTQQHYPHCNAGGVARTRGCRYPNRIDLPSTSMSALLRSINVKAAPAVRPAARLRAKAPARAAPARKAMSVRATGRDLNTSSRPGETLEQTAARRYNESMAVQQRTVVRPAVSLCSHRHMGGVRRGIGRWRPVVCRASAHDGSRKDGCLSCALALGAGRRAHAPTAERPLTGP
jgi:hypothetical protein